MFPSKEISLIFAFGPSVITNDSCWPAPPMFFASCLTVAKGRPFAESISLMIDSDLACLRLVVERVELDLRLALLQLVLDVRRREVLRAAVVDDLDPLALRHPEDHDLALRPVGHVDLEVLEEARVPQATEVRAEGSLVVLVAGPGVHVVEKRLLREHLVAGDLDGLDDWPIGGSLLGAERSGQGAEVRDGHRPEECGEESLHGVSGTLTPISSPRRVESSCRRKPPVTTVTGGSHLTSPSHALLRVARRYERGPPALDPLRP